MTTDRPYKRRRPANEVIEDLQRNAGKQFAPELVTAFCRGMLKELTGETKEKRFRRLLGREYMEAEGIVPISLGVGGIIEKLTAETAVGGGRFAELIKRRPAFYVNKISDFIVAKKKRISFPCPEKKKSAFDSFFTVNSGSGSERRCLIRTARSRFPNSNG
jgi:hypothetical protein